MTSVISPKHLLFSYLVKLETFLVLSLTIYSIFFHFQVPYNVAFKNKTSEDVSLLVVDSIVDVIFFIDIGKYFI